MARDKSAASTDESGTQHAFDFLNRAPQPVPGVVVLFGTESFLRRLARKRLQAWVLDDNPDAVFALLEGESADWCDVADELATVSLFAPKGRRLVVVAEADKFVSQHREQLEQYVERPKRTGVLVLEVETWSSTTRLYKAVQKSAWQIDCRLPLRGKSKTEIDGALVGKWLTEWAQARHQISLNANAARLLLDLAGPELGIVDQELAKLALFAGEGGKVSAELVQEIVGGWKAKTIWDTVTAAANGEAAEALRQLDRALQSGEAPVGLFGQISWSLRRYAVATRLYQRAERRGERISLRQAISQAGFYGGPEALADAEQQLMQLGRDRAGRLFSWLLELDLALKGSHSAPDRSRWALEQLFLKMARRTK